jgi:hypothetical protein
LNHSYLIPNKEIEMVTKQAHNEIKPTEVTRNQKMQIKRKVQTAVAATAVMVMLATLTPREANAWGPGTPPIPGGNCTGCTIYNHNETLILDVD